MSIYIQSIYTLDDCKFIMSNGLIFFYISKDVERIAIHSFLIPVNLCSTIID